MSAATDKRISQTTQIVICVLFVVGVRAYYALVEANTRALYPWFADHPGRLIGLHVLALPVATAGAMAARRWFSPVLIIPIGVACGALVTLVYSSLTGGLIGLVCGALVCSSQLRSFALSLLRTSCCVWIPGLLLGALLGAAVAGATTAAGDEWTLAILIGQWIMVLLMVVIATWLALRSKSLASWIAARCLIAMGFLLVTLIGLPLGTTLNTCWRMWALRDVADVDWNPVPWSQIPTQGYLSVSGAHIEGANDEQIGLLQGFPHVNWLMIQKCDASSAAIATMLKQLRQLEYVRFEDVAIDNEVVRALAYSKQIATLDLIRTNVSDGAFEPLALMPQLRYLAIADMRREGGSLKPLAKAGRLRSLLLENVPLTDADLADLSGLRPLFVLSLKNAQITGSGLHHLQSHPQLTSLELIDCPLEGQYLADLIPLKLNWLTVHGVPLTDQGAQAIGSMKSLVGVSLLRSGITDAQLTELNRLRSPQLVLDASQLSQASSTSLGKADEVELRIEQTSVTSRDIQRLGELGQDVVLDSCTFTDDAIERLKAYEGSSSFTIQSSELSEAVVRQLSGSRVSVQ